MRIVPLAGAARVAVRALEGERLAVVHHLRALRVGQIAGNGIEARLERADQRPAIRNRLGHLDADDGLVDVVGRPQPLRPVALLADQPLGAVDERGVPGRAVGVVHEAGVEGRVEGERAVAQRAIGSGGIEKTPDAGEAIFRLGRRGLGGRQDVGGVSETNHAESGHCCKAKCFHDLPHAPDLLERPL